MDHYVEKLLYSRRDAAVALSLSIRSIDYLITTSRLAARRVGGKILIPASAIRRFAREDHPGSVRSVGAHETEEATAESQHVQEPTSRFGPRSAHLDDSRNRSANGRR
jgi:hypothetical protein